MQRISSPQEAERFQLFTLLEVIEDEKLWASYVEMRERHEEDFGATGEPDAINNDQEATELKISTKLKQEFKTSVEQGFNEKTDYRYVLVDTEKREALGETVIYPPDGPELAWSNSMTHPQLRGKRTGIGNVLLARVLEKAQEIFRDENNPMLQATIRSPNVASWRRFQKLVNAGLARYIGEIRTSHHDRVSYEYQVPLYHDGKPVHFMDVLTQKSESMRPDTQPQ